MTDAKKKKLLGGLLCATIPAAVLLLLCAVFYVYLLSHVGGAGDWAYRDLPGGYEIIRLNGSHIVLDRPNFKDGSRHVIKGYITAFCCEGPYIGVRQIAVDDRAHEVPEDGEVSYYLVDTAEDELRGPLTQEAYLRLCEELGIGLSDWIPTKPAPEGADYG